MIRVKGIHMTEDWITFFGISSCFLYLLFKIYKKRVALYLKIFIAAIGCYALGKLYSIVTIYSFGSLPEGFNLKYVCTFGSFLFLASANYGVMNHIMDDGSKDLRKYRLLALLGPICVVGLMLRNIHLATNDTLKIVYAILTIPIAFSSYYSFKQVLLPDMNFLFLKLVKPCNILISIISILACFGMNTQILENKPTLSCILTILFCLLLTHFIARSLKQWKI